MLKKFYLLLMLLLPCYAMAQSLSLFDLDASSFPTIKAKFYAFDASGQQITNLNPSDFELKENGTQRNVTFVSCPQPQPPQALSSVLVMDVSGSMCGTGLDIAKGAANAWIDLLPLGKSDCAITSFSDANYINQDFTTNKTKLVNGINSLTCMGGTDYNAAMIDAMAGGVLIAKTGKNKRVIVFLSDGGPNSEPRTSEIISQANANNIVIYCVTIRMTAPQCMRDMSNQTGGMWFENIRTKEEVEECYRKILMTAQGGDPCQIEWQSGVSCFSGIKNVELRITSLDLKAKASYQSPNTAVAKLDFNPVSLKFADPIPGMYAPVQTVTVTALNADFIVSNISTKIPVGFDINPKSFSLKNGESIELTVTYYPADSGYNYCKFDVESQPCPTKFYVSGGWKGIKPTIRTIKLLHPNGGEVFVAGIDTLITWEGISPDEPVKIDYSTNNGASWIKIADSAKGLSYNWRVPKTPSWLCLARVTAEAKTSSYCDNPDVELCGKIWMGCNLDVETYRNGDPIPEVTDSTEWANLTTGAWCYYNNDPANGEIYGKLYNCYAVNDPRGLAPDGWHVPTDAEWTELEDCLIANGYNYDGTTTGNKIAKALATASGWNSYSSTGSVGNTDYPAKRNSTGFSALPGGYRYFNGVYYSIGYDGIWWSAAESYASYAWNRYLTYDSTNIYRVHHYKEYGYSVRCVRD